MAAGAWTLYNDFKANLSKKRIDLSADTIKCALFLSTSNAMDAALVGAQYASLTNQHANANGYTTGGVTVAGSLTGGGATSTITFDTADASWTASGGNIVARAAVLYSDTSANKDCIAYMLLDSTPADVTVQNGNTLTIQIANVFTLA